MALFKSQSRLKVCLPSLTQIYKRHNSIKWSTNEFQHSISTPSSLFEASLVQRRYMAGSTERILSFCRRYVAGAPQQPQVERMLSSCRRYMTGAPKPPQVERMLSSCRRYVAGAPEQPQEEGRLGGVTVRGDVVTVDWEGSQSVSYLTTWLRDNCTCPKCYHPSSDMRLQLMADLDLNLVPEVARIEGNSLVIHWHGGHISTFEEKWLQERTSPQTRRAPKKTLWGSTFSSNIPRLEYTQLLKDDTFLLSCLHNLEEFGIVIIKGVPCQIDAIKTFSKRIGFLKMNHYGDNFEVISKASPNNLAYTSAPLGFHLDLPYYNYTPGTQLLHCIKQHHAQGGDSQFCDAFALADKIRKFHPEEWEVLTTVPVQFFDRGVTDYGEMKGEKFNKVTHFHTINLGPQGQVNQICFNNTARDTNLVADLDTTRRLYKSLKLFIDLAYGPDLAINLKMDEGDMVWFDNLRVMHGRTGFVVEEGLQGGRHLQGGYIDWDEIWSRINVLTNKIHQENK